MLAFRCCVSVMCQGTGTLILSHAGCIHNSWIAAWSEQMDGCR